MENDRREVVARGVERSETLTRRGLGALAAAALAALGVVREADAKKKRKKKKKKGATSPPPPPPPPSCLAGCCPTCPPDCRCVSLLSGGRTCIEDGWAGNDCGNPDDPPCPSNEVCDSAGICQTLCGQTGF
jgi:hypothetical protein